MRRLTLRNRFFRSMFIFGSILSVIFFVYFYFNVRRIFLNQLIETGKLHTIFIVNTFGPKLDEGLRGVGELKKIRSLLYHAREKHFERIVVYNMNGKIVVDTDGGMPPEEFSSEEIRGVKYLTRFHKNTLLILQPYISSNGEHRYTFLFFIPLEYVGVWNRRFFLSLLLWFIGLILFVIIASEWNASMVTSPVSELSRQIEEFKKGERDEIKVSTGTEIDDFARFLSGVLTELNFSLKELERLNRAKSDFIAVVSHELKTPLTAAKGYIEFILSGKAGKITKKIKSNLEVVERNLSRLEDRILNILKFSRGEVVGELRFEPVSLNILVEEVLIDNRRRIEKKGLKLRKVLEKGLPSVYVNREKIREVIENILDNAIKFTDNGYIEVRTYQVNREIVLSVTDSGRGIPEERLEAVFDRFTRFDKTRSGMGLGLAIVKEVMEAHGGVVQVKSRLGEGTTVALKFKSGLEGNRGEDTGNR